MGTEGFCRFPRHVFSHPFRLDRPRRAKAQASRRDPGAAMAMGEEVEDSEFLFQQLLDTRQKLVEAWRKEMQRKA
eukprot:6800938-Heterocapsa_arctica.AAC.1